MEPDGPSVLLAAEHARAALEASPVWVPALAGGAVRPPALHVTSLVRTTDSYFVVEIFHGDNVSARFALDSEGILLEAEGVKDAHGRLAPWVTPSNTSRDAQDRAEMVWKPCEQSRSRLRPFYKVTGGFVRVDGAVFEHLTAAAGRG